MPKLPVGMKSESPACDRCNDTGILVYSYRGTESHEKCPCNAADRVSKVYIGIDPGQAGGLVALFSSGKIEASVMPDTELGIWQWFDSVRRNNCHAVIEKVHSMPDQSSQSSFTFGKGYGGLRMCLIAAGIPFEEVTPQAWQKALGTPPKKKDESKGQWKNRLLALAQQLFPPLELWKEKKSKTKQLAIADALLIAEFCKRKQEGKL